LEPKIIYEKDPNLNNGEQVVKQEGAKGYKVTAERIIWEHGTPLREPLPSSYYHPINRIIAIGTREVTTPVLIPPAEAVKPTEPPEEVTEPKPEPEPAPETGDETVPQPDRDEKLPPEAGGYNANLEDSYQSGG
jgi:outer membrane biosynthesis protein TonB